MALTHGGPAPCDRAGIERGECPAVYDAACKRWALVLAVVGSSLAFIEGSVVNVALPSIQRDLGLAAADAQWILNAYLVTLSGLMLLGGALGDRWGVRRVYAAGVALFGLGALACGVAPGWGSLIAARAGQGVGGALLVPSSLALISRVYPRDERGAAIGTWAGFSALTTALGPVLGGWLTDAWHWRAVFLVIPLPALLAAGLALSRIPPLGRDAGRGTDWAGAALGVAALAGLSLGFLLAGERGWRDPLVLGALAAGAVLGAVFVRLERRIRSPMLPLRLFRSRPFAGANAMTLLLYAALNACLLLVPFLLIQVRGLSPTAAGAAFLPFTLVMGLGSRYAGRWLSGAHSGRWLALGSLVAGGGMAWMAALRSGVFALDVLPGMLLLGIGMTVAVPPLTTTVMNSVDAADAGAASGVNNAAARVAGLIGIALLGSLAVAGYQGRLARALDAVDLPAEVRRSILERSDELVAAPLPEALAPARTAAVEAARRGAFLDAFSTVLYLATGLAAAAGLVGLATVRGRPGAAAEARSAQARSEVS